MHVLKDRPKQKVNINKSKYEGKFTNARSKPFRLADKGKNVELIINKTQQPE
jgi:hypothetical protein